MLVDFPIALLGAALLFDLTSVATGDAFWSRAALYNATLGYGLALTAVAAGAIDLFLVIPAHRRSYRAAAAHALFALLALLLYGVGLAIRSAAPERPRPRVRPSSRSRRSASSCLGQRLGTVVSWSSGTRSAWRTMQRPEPTGRCGLRKMCGRDARHREGQTTMTIQTTIWS